MLQRVDDIVTLQPRWPAAPFPGLRPFRITTAEDESLIFYGRDRAKDEILARLNSNHLVFVVGPSGCGKSSLLKVGVIPALEAGLLTRMGANWRTAEMRPGIQPVRNLACALATLRSNASAGDVSGQIYDVLCSDRDGLWLVVETFAPRGTTKPLLILIDQFEEVFGSQISAQTESKLLAELLVAFWAKPHPNLFLVVTMRTDFLEQCANFPKLADAINATLFITPVLRDSEIKSVISLPPEPYHGIVEHKLVETLIKDTSSDIGYNPDHLPLLQHALSWLWNNAISAAGHSSSPPRPDSVAPLQTIILTYDRYVAHGGLKGILNEHANELLSRLTEREQRIAKVLFTRLSERDENRYRRSPTSAAALARLANCDAAELEKVVSVFSDPSVCFLDRRPLNNEAGELIDVSHESLIRQWDRLRVWADEEAEKVRGFRSLAAQAVQWQLHGRSPSFLKRGGDLAVWRQWWKSQSPSAEWAKRYKLDHGDPSASPEPIELSKAYLTQGYRRRLLIWFGLAMAVFLMGVTPLLLIKREKTQLETARYETAAARGTDLLNNEDPSLALLLALEFLRRPEVQSRAIEALAYKALQTPLPKVILSVSAEFPTATFSPDGRLLLIANENAFQVWDTETVTPIANGYRPKAVYVGRRAIWSADGRWIITATNDERTALVAPCSVPVLRNYFQRCENNNEDEVWPVGEIGTTSWPSTLNSTGDRLLSGGQTPQIWDIKPQINPPFAQSTSLLRSGPDAQGPVSFGIAFNQQGDRFVLGSADGSIRIHETANPTERFLLRPQTRCQENGDPQPVQVFSMAFNPEKDKGDEIVAVTLDGCLRLWNVKEKRLLKAHYLGNTGFFFVTYDPTGQRIAITSDDGVVRIWEPGNSYEPELVLRGHRRATWTVEFSRQTNLLASASPESVRIWTLKPAIHASKLSTSHDRFGAVTFASRGGALTLNTGKWRDVTLDDPHSGRDVVAAAVSNDKNRVLVAEEKKTIRLYDTRNSHQPLARFEVPGVEWKAVGFLNEPDRIVGETTKGEIYTWPFFKDRNALIEFAEKHLPINQDGERISLSQQDKCRFGIETTSRSCT
jgi:WD40 repeat protein